MIALSWLDVKRAHPIHFDRIVRMLGKRHDGDRGELIDLLDEEYTISINDDGCLFLEHDRSGFYNMLC